MKRLIIRFVMWLTKDMDAFIILRSEKGCSVKANFSGKEMRGAFKEEFEKDSLFRETILSAAADYLSRFPEERNRFAKRLYND